MSETLKVRITARVGDPRSGVILQPGTVADLPRTWADRYVGQGKAEVIAADPKPEPKKKRR